MIRSKAKLMAILALAGATVLSACGPRLSEQDCLERAMYFESNRSSRDGMIAVGSVVMNRVQSGEYPRDICGVVGQKKQFAPGVLHKKMNDRSVPMVREAAHSVIRGERHPYIQNAKFFHTYGYNANYNNMHYVLTAGGNAFYERRKPALVTQAKPLPPLEGVTPRRF